MKKNYRKIGIALVVIAVIFASTFLFRDKENSTSKEVEIITTLSDTSVFTYSNDTNVNSFYFIVVMNGIGISKLDIVPTFDKDVTYEISYENIKKRSSLPIEYYLAQETDFDFEELDEFNEYLSIRKLYDDYEVNDQYEDYIKSYGENADFKKYLSNYSMYMVEVKVTNASGTTNLTNVTMSSEVDESQVEVIYSEDTNVSFVNTASNSNGLYTIKNENYETSDFFDGKVIYTYDVSCNRELSFNGFKLARYSLIEVSGYNQSGEKLSSLSCKSGETISFDVKYEVGTDFVSGDSIDISFVVDGRNETMHSPQIFIPSNYMLVMEDDYSGYSDYLEYKFNLR